MAAHLTTATETQHFTCPLFVISATCQVELHLNHMPVYKHTYIIMWHGFWQVSTLIANAGKN